MNLLGVRRAPCFSPRSEERDEAILQAVKAELEQTGAHRVTLTDEYQLCREAIPADIDGVFSMARSREALLREAEVEHRGIPVLNSAIGRLHLCRRRLLSCCRAIHFPVPEHEEADGPLSTCTLPFPFWFKRDDRTTQQAGDVRFIAQHTDWEEVMAFVREEGVSRYILEQHLPGDLIKFYGVAGTDFFHYGYPTAPNGFSKFGTERINGQAQGTVFDCRALKRLADALAGYVGIPIYGGDAVVSADGDFRLIDFNDWPSFAPCRPAAAAAIAACLRQSRTPVHSDTIFKINVYG